MNATLDILDWRRLNLPASPAIAGWHVHEFTDSVGDPAINVFVTLKPHPEQREYTWDEVRPIQDEVFRALREAGDTRFAYVYFGTVEEP